MSILRSFLFALALSACSSPCRRPCPVPAPDSVPAAESTVAAKRYRTWVVDGVMEATHGGGRLIEELWFPEQGVVANGTDEFRADVNDWKPVLNAFHGPMRNVSSRGLHDPPTASPVEDVRVPAALAREIFEAADLRRRLDAARDSIGTRLRSPSLLREVPSAE